MNSKTSFQNNNDWENGSKIDETTKENAFENWFPLNFRWVENHLDYNNYQNTVHLFIHNEFNDFSSTSEM